jgi:hypothetical protein
MDASKVKRFAKAAVAGALAVSVLGACDAYHEHKGEGSKAEAKEKAGCNQAAGKKDDKMKCSTKMGCSMPMGDKK